MMVGANYYFRELCVCCIRVASQANFRTTCVTLSPSCPASSFFFLHLGCFVAETRRHSTSYHTCQIKERKICISIGDEQK